MNINKFSKSFLPVLMVTSSTLFITGCDLFDSDDETPPALAQCEDGIDNDTDGLIDFPDDPGCIDALDNDETDPPPPPPVPTDGITGIWTGSFTWFTTGQQKDYEVTMLFYTPEGIDEGTTGGAAFDVSTTDPAAQFLFEGGYSYYADPIVSDPLKDNSTIACDGDVWAVGRYGSKGTFMQEFSYETGSAAGPDQRGAGCFYLRDVDGDGYVNELTGEISFEQGGKFAVDLTYSIENTRTVAASDMGTLGTDDVEYHLWSNDNSGTSMSYTSGATTTDTIDIAVVESHATATCVGDVKLTRVASHNLFTLQTNTNVAGCSVDPAGAVVDLEYLGLGALLDLDGDNKLTFVHLMASKGGGAGDTAQALYNEFAIQ